MLLINSKDLQNKNVTLTVVTGQDKTVVKLYRPKPGIAPFAGEIIDSIVLSAEDRNELKKNL